MPFDRFDDLVDREFFLATGGKIFEGQFTAGDLIRSNNNGIRDRFPVSIIELLPELAVIGVYLG